MPVQLINNNFSFLHSGSADLSKFISEKDAAFIANKIDSIKNSKTIDWNTVLLEAEKLEERKTNTINTISVFKGHALRSVTTQIPLAKTNNSGWMLGVILISLLILGAVRQLNNKRLLSFISAFFATRFAGQLQREEYAINNRAGSALLITFVLVFSLFIFQVLEYFGLTFSNQPPLLIYLIICCAVSAIYIFKIIFIRIIATIFNSDAEAKEYVFYILLFNQLLGIILLPFVCGISFIKNFNPSILLYSGLVIFSIFFIYRILRGILMGFSRPKISKFYLFLYLCTLEFLPLLFAYKFLVKF